MGAKTKRLKNVIKSINAAYNKQNKSVKNNEVSINKLEKIINEIKIVYKNTKIENKLKNKIEVIRKTYIKNWKKENLSFVEKVVDKLSPNKGIPIPVLSVCGKGTREIRFTRYLAYYLDSSNNHGLGNQLLYTMLNEECKKAGLPPNWSENCSVHPEYYLGDIKIKNNEASCRADIVIIGDNFLIIIEHKILSSESDHPELDISQLERYNKAIETNKKFRDRNILKILLNPNANQGESYQGWIEITHNDIVDRGINLLNEESLSSTGKENLMRLLIDLAVGPYEVMMEGLEEIHFLGQSLLKKGYRARNAVKFDRLTNEYEQIIAILLEGGQ